MNFSELIKYLITNYHVINPSLENENILLEIWNQKTIKLNLKNRCSYYIDIPKDITIIEIKQSDEIYEDIEFLNYDLNFMNQGYSIYKDADIFTIEHPCGDDVSCASGKIINIDDYEFDHNISTETGSSGSPILLLNNNINLVQVIGIHKNADYSKKLNGGTFIGEIIKEINKGKKDHENSDNFIIAELDINEKNINKDIRILNSYEEFSRTLENEQILIKDNIYKNEDEIRKCQIKINDRLIPFNYVYKFKLKGNYVLKYSFQTIINKTDLMFADCSYLKNIDLSNFKSQNIKNTNSMFRGCTSLTNINLSNLNIEMSLIWDVCLKVVLL